MRVKGDRTLKVAQQAESKGNLRLLWAFGEGRQHLLGGNVGNVGARGPHMGASPGGPLYQVIKKAQTKKNVHLMAAFHL